MAIKKSELYSSLWKGCDELRGGMDASQYKDYVLVLLFVKYVSDKYAGQPDALIEVPEGGSFKDMLALKGDKEIGDKINKIIARLAEANDLKGVIDVADFNDADKLGKGREMQDRLSNLVSIFDSPGLNFSSNRAEGDDILGDAYEYLMRHFATESGKSKGQFYTPAEVSRIMAKVIGINAAKSQSQTIYDPTCGSGSLLLKAADESKTGVTIYGQEMDNATAALAKMNMILHDNPTAEIWQDNTLSSPHFKERDGTLKLHDFVVANPPFSTKAWSNGFDPANDLYERFVDGIPPDKNGDYAFLLHIIRSLKSTGKGAVILPHGVLFRGNAEGGIRRNIIRRGYIKGIIGLPANLFYGTGIPACIIVLDKEAAAGRTGLFMIDASKGFVKDGNKNRLRHQDIHKIVDVFNKQLEIAKYARMVSLAEIEANDYNLNIPRYIDSSEAEDLQDIAAHLQGGIPDADVDGMSAYWQVFPSLQTQLFERGTRAGYSQMKVAAAIVKPSIFAHPEFVTYTQAVSDLFQRWNANNAALLKSLSAETHPKQLIEALSEDLLATFAEVKLIDQYDVYQHLMSYWSDIMQDDAYLIAADGWQAGNDASNGLIPPQLIITRYFAVEREAIEQLEAERDAITRIMEEMDEEQGGEDGLLAEAKNDKGKLTKVTVAARLKDTGRVDKRSASTGNDDERAMLANYLSLIEQESAASKKVKDAQKQLDAKVAAQYAKLCTDDIKTLVVDDKWLTTLAADVQTELDRVSQALTGRIKQLAERYAEPLPQLAADVAALNVRVEAHLKQMGFI
ncbi:MAG: type I restriction-modification system subunit M [Gallionella sp.]|nr:type I restriction-modification system subunit M [Gallionella sp.]MDP1939350.1 type I restriction-modification system subunit M [Gallionella sp.]